MKGHIFAVTLVVIALVMPVARAEIYMLADPSDIGEEPLPVSLINTQVEQFESLPK